MKKEEKYGKERMLSRERVIKAIEHKPVDRVPIDFGMHFSSGISAFSYYDLLEYLGEDTSNVRISDMVQFLARIDRKILELFHSDCMLLYPYWPKEKKWNPKGKYSFQIPAHINPEQGKDGEWRIEYKGETIRMPKESYFFDGGWPFFHPYDFDTYLDKTAAEAERIFSETEYFTAYHAMGAFFQSANMDYLCDMITEPEEVKKMHSQWLESEIELINKIIKKMGKNIQGIVLNSDLGTQKGPFCRPEVYEEVSAPYLKKLCSYIHDNSDYKILLHTCGSIEPLISILSECGIDAINPVQISAADMDPFKLKEKHGKKMTFWGGGCDTQNILGTGNEDRVRENVKKLMEIFKPESGFVFSQVHNIM